MRKISLMLLACLLGFILISCSEVGENEDSNTITNSKGETVVKVGDFTHLLPEGIVFNSNRTENMKESVKDDAASGVYYNDLQIFTHEKEIIYIASYKGGNMTNQDLEFFAKGVTSAGQGILKTERKKIGGIDAIVTWTLAEGYNEVILNFVYNKKGYDLCIAAIDKKDIDEVLSCIEESLKVEQ